MAEPVSPRLTYHDLLQMPDDGPRYELIDGEAYIIPGPPGPDARHQTALLQLAIQLQNAIRDQSRVYIAPFDVIFAEDTVLQPDVLLLSPAGLSKIKRSLEGPPDLAVELLSPTSIRRDRGIKLATYARFGVGEYWLVDLENPAIEVYRLQQGAPPSYRLEGIYRPGDRVTTPLLPALALDPATLFPYPD
jgi:Uma2 family endonuclease